MFRGTTPTVTYTLPFDTTDATKLWITFSQRDKEIFTLEKENLTITENIVQGKLTQKQTLALTANAPVEMQIRLTFPGDTIEDALASDIITTSVQRILKDGEI